MHCIECEFKRNFNRCFSYKILEGHLFFSNLDLSVAQSKNNIDLVWHSKRNVNTVKIKLKKKNKIFDFYYKKKLLFTLTFPLKLRTKFIIIPLVWFQSTIPTFKQSDGFHFTPFTLYSNSLEYVKINLTMVYQY